MHQIQHSHNFRFKIRFRINNILNTHKQIKIFMDNTLRLINILNKIFRYINLNNSIKVLVIIHIKINSIIINNNKITIFKINTKINKIILIKTIKNKTMSKAASFLKIINFSLNNNQLTNITNQNILIKMKII